MLVTKSKLNSALENQRKAHLSSQMALGKKYSARMADMEEKQATLREAIQITNANLMLRLQGDSSGDSNDYMTHELQVQEIMRLYAAETEVGHELAKRIINVGAALKVPNGLALQFSDEKNKGKNPESVPEWTYLSAFIDANQLNEGIATELAKEAEKQGQVLVRLIWDQSDNMVKLFYMPWHIYKYIVRPIGVGNMTPPYEIVWDENPDYSIKAGRITTSEAAFVAFNTIFKADDKNRMTIEGSPSLGNVVTNLDNISRDLYNWKQSNRLYAYPTPHLGIEDADEAESMASKIKAQGWSTGNMLVSSGKFEMVVPENFHLTIKTAIETNVKIVSGATGLSVGWLGFPDQMSNRATADSLGEPLETVTANDITSFKSFYEQVFTLAIRIRNEKSGKEPIRTNVVKPLLKPMSDRVWQRLIRLYMPSAEQSLMSIEGYLRQIPGLDVEAELKRMKSEVESGIRTNDNRKSNPDNRADTGQQSTGSQRFNNERGQRRR